MRKANRKVLLSLLVITGLTSGCGVADKIQNSIKDIELPYVEIPWQWFQKDKTVKVEEKVIAVSELALAEKNEKAVVEELASKVDSLEELLTDKKVYTEGLSDRSSFDERIGSIFGGSHQKDAGKAFYTVLEEIYSDEYTAVDSVSLASIGRNSIEDKETITLSIEVNATNDSMEYNVYVVHITVGTDLGIQSAEVSEEAVLKGHTTRSLTTDSFVEEETHSEFLNAFDDYSESFRNELLYTKLMNKEDGSEGQLQVYLNEIIEEDDSEESIKELFMQSKGDLSNGVFTGMILSDKDALAETIYLFSVPSTKEVKTFEIQYDRSENTISSINKQ